MSDERDQCTRQREGRWRKKEIMKANEVSEELDNLETKKHHRTRGRCRTRRKRLEVKTSVERQMCNGTCDNWRKGGENMRKKQRKCGMSQERSSASRSGQIAAMTSRKGRGDSRRRGERKVREEERSRNESEEKRRFEEKPPGQEEREAVRAQEAHRKRRERRRREREVSAQEDRERQVRGEIAEGDREEQEERKRSKVEEEVRERERKL